MLPRAERSSNIEELVDAIAACALVGSSDIEARRRVVLIAAQHGENRRRSSLPETVLPTEFHLLSRAIWRYLNETWRGADDTFTAILEIDSLMTMAQNASMWGYFREEVEGQVAWDEAIDKLIATDSFDAEPV